MHLQLLALFAACFPGIPSDQIAEASSALHFEQLSPEALGHTLFAIGSASTRTAAGVASRLGLYVSTRALSVLGAVVSSGDFVYSLLTDNPNRTCIQQVKLSQAS